VFSPVDRWISPTLPSPDEDMPGVYNAGLDAARQPPDFTSTQPQSFT
jgi:hypothetical protein